MELHNLMVKLLKSLPNIHDKSERRAFIYSASLDLELEDKIEFEGSTEQFGQLLVKTLGKYGTLKDGRHAFEAILDASKNRVGQEGKELCDETMRILRISEEQGDSIISSEIHAYQISIDIYHLPTPTTPLVGRKKELVEIDRAFQDINTHIIAFVAAGGIGKSAITDEWLRQMKKKNYAGARRIFGWSFYSQGSHETQTSSGLFFEAALPFFGHNETQSVTDDVTRGRRLAELLRQEPCILVLDGIEPLQHRKDVFGGRLKDTGIYSLLRDVSKHGLPEFSLLIISSRQPLMELENSLGTGYQKIALQNLNEEDGIKLLKTLKVQGLPHELMAAVQAYDGHALALVLLGNLLIELYEGDVNQYRQLPLLEDNQEGSHAQRILRFYDEKCWNTDAPERSFLRLLGLFDRPMGEGEKNVLLEKAEIAQPLKRLSGNEWRQMFAHLRKLGLLLEEKITLNQKIYSTHPLIRSYFDEQLRSKHHAAWQQAHLLLFEHFQSVPEKDQPDTLEELEPLYRAIHHGCFAGEYKKALEKIYWERILRDNEYYSVKKLGTYTTDLATLADFFSQDWTKPTSAGLSEFEQGWLLQAVSFYLMTLGRLEESLQARQTHMHLAEEIDDWRGVARSAESLVDVLLLLGRLIDAKNIALYGMDKAKQADDTLQQVANQCKLAATLHRLGAFSESLSEFQLAEKLQASHQPSYSHLYSLSGVECCKLLLNCARDAAEQEDVLKRGHWAITMEKDRLLNIALDRLIIARTLMAMNSPDESLFNTTIADMRKAGSMYDMPEVLLARSAFFLNQRKLAAAQNDLVEAWEIIDHCGMRLYEADAWLLQGNIMLDRLKTENICGILDEAIQAYSQAKKLLENMQYGLRTTELYLLEARCALYVNTSDAAREHLSKAKQRIEEVGQWGLMSEWKKVQDEIEYFALRSLSS